MRDQALPGRRALSTGEPLSPKVSELTSGAPDDEAQASLIRIAVTASRRGEIPRGMHRDGQRSGRPRTLSRE
jgi:hypothetical protein